MEPSEPPPAVEPTLLAATFSPSGQIVRCNDAWQSILGPSETPWARLDDTDRDIVDNSVLEAGKGTLVTNQVVSAHTSERDEPFPVLLHFVPVYSPENEAHRIAAVTVNGEVMAEPPSWMVSQTQRHRMETLGRMTMGVAHDLNNLLSSLVGHIELLRNRAARNESDLDTIKPSLRTIEQTAEDGAVLIERLQRYIRQDTEEHFERLDLTSLVEDAITLTQPYWYNEPRREGIEIEVEKDLQSVPSIKGSPTELREVFVNLILNAVQAMPDGGKLSFATFVDDQERACVRVRDTGVGMSSEVQEKIFDPLFTTKGNKGTGMGLSASYGIVQEHNGDIQVSSTQGEGTVFTLSFPTVSTGRSSSSGTKQASSKEEGEGVRVLVVDDEERVRAIAAQLLSMNGHTVDQAPSGKAALSMLGDAPYDIVFTDYGMPEMTGAELARRIRERDPELPIVLLTGYTDTGGAVTEADDLLSKPFKLDDLEATIQEHVGSRASS